MRDEFVVEISLGGEERKIVERLRPLKSPFRSARYVLS